MTISLNDPRDDIARSISFESSRVTYNNHTIFVCGGKVDATQTANISARNMLMNKSARKSSLKFILAESYKDWFQGYSDLSEFETDIAGLSSVVVVILESAGSLAELGLFYAHEHIRTKLFAVVDASYYKEDSFIKHGLLNPLEALEKNFVLAFDLPPLRPQDYKDDDIIEILDEIDDFCGNLPETEPTSSSDQGHVLYFIFEIIKLYNALTSTEVKRYLELAGLKVHDARLKSCMHILKKFELVIEEKKSSQNFFMPHPEAHSRIHLKSRTGLKPFDIAASTIQINRYYIASSFHSRSDKNRVALIKKYSVKKDQENEAA